MRLVKEGERRLMSRDIEGAIGRFSDAIRIDPENAMHYYRRSMCYQMMMKPDKALSDLNEAIRLYPEKGLFYVNRGSLLAKFKKDYKGALADFARAIEAGNDTVEVRVMRAAAYMELGDYAAARREAGIAERISPGHRMVLEVIKDIEHRASGKKGPRPGAAALGGPGMAGGGPNFSPQQQACFAHLKAGELEKALAVLRRPGSLDTTMRLVKGMLFYGTGKYREAAAEMRGLMEGGTRKQALAYLFLAKARLEGIERARKFLAAQLPGGVAKVEDHLDAVFRFFLTATERRLSFQLRSTPAGFCEAYFLLGELKVVTGRSDLALPYFDRAVARPMTIFPPYQIARRRLAEIRRQ